MILHFHSTTLTTPSLDLTQCLARYLQKLLMSIALVAGDPSDVRDAWRNGRAGITRRVALVQHATPAAYITCRAHVSLGHGGRQVRDGVIMGLYTQQVDPLG